MFTQLSKLVLIATVATSCFMMGCQKKGARGVKVTAGTATMDNKTTDGKDKDIQIGDINPEIKPPASGGSVSGDNTSNDNTNTSGDNTTTSGDNTTTSGDNTTVSTDSTKADGGKKDEDKKTETDKKDEDKKVEVQSCSKDVVNAANTIQNANKTLESLAAEEKAKQYNAIMSLCNDWSALLAKEKTSSCTLKAGEKSYIATANSWNSVCFAAGDALKAIEKKDNKYSLKADEANIAALKYLKAQSLVASEEGKELLAMNNQDWKLYLTEGKLQSNEKDLSDLYKAKKVACSITTMGEVALTQDTLVKMNITKIVELVPYDDSSEIKNGIDMHVKLTLSSKSDKEADVTTAAGVLSCVNIKAARLNVGAIKAALGEHIVIENK